jgi:hypothetical protein
LLNSTQDSNRRLTGGNNSYLKGSNRDSVFIAPKTRNKGRNAQIELDEDAGEIILKPITREFVHSLRGKLKGKGLLKALMAEKKEREL